MSTSITKGWLLIVIFTVAARPVAGWAQSSALERYINEAFQSNEGLKQERLQLDQSLNALKQAKTLYYPNVSLQSTYTRAAGGRTIDIPVGDLLNPVYNSLNALTHSSSFPTVGNASILLNPDNYFDGKFHTTLPLINAEIWYNEKIRKVLISQLQAAVNVYKRELVKTVKEAYYQYYMADRALEIYNNALALVNENIRVNRSLVKNGVRNTTVLTRALAEQEKINASITDGTNKKQNARLYFNFLLNRAADSDIEIDTAIFKDEALQQPAAATVKGEREELAQLKAAINAYDLERKMRRSYIVPKLNTFLDLGTQAFKFSFNDKSQYYFWGINLQWDLFSAGQDKYKIKDAQYTQSIAQSRYEQAEKSIELENAQAVNNYYSAYASFKNATAQYGYAYKYYNDELKAYKEGSALYLELIDALNQLTTAGLQENIARANILIAIADLERKQATYPIQ